MSQTSIAVADLLEAGRQPVAADDGEQARRLNAERHYAANRAAVGRTQPDLRLPVQPPAAHWVQGRDGYLTARTELGAWWAGCSVPLAAGRELLKPLEMTGPLACFLEPAHAGFLRAVFEKIQPNQAIIAVIASDEDLAVMLGCDDFSGEIDAHRLWLVSGWTWQQQLASLLQSRSGLPLPTQFIRTAVLEEEALQRLIRQAQAVIQAESTRRADHVRQSLSRGPSERPACGRICVVAGQRLRLWTAAGETQAMAGAAMAKALLSGAESSPGWILLDSDDPVSSSPTALADAAGQCDAIVVADIGRTDLPNVAPALVPWICWVTTARVPAFDSTAPADGLLLTDPALLEPARQLGWPGNRIAIAGWPCLASPAAAPAQGGQPAGKALGFMVDLCPPKKPERLEDLSSLGLLWDVIEQELGGKPLLVGNNPAAYLESRRQRAGVPPDTLDSSVFIDRLILPAYCQGLARWLMQLELPLVLFGRGWEKLPEFRGHFGGVIGSTAELAIACGVCSALVYPGPAPRPHPIDALGLPLLHPTAALPRLARQGWPSLLASLAAPSRQASPLTRESVTSLISAYTDG